MPREAVESKEGDAWTVSPPQAATRGLVSTRCAQLNRSAKRAEPMRPTEAALAIAYLANQRKLIAAFMGALARPKAAMKRSSRRRAAPRH